MSLFRTGYDTTVGMSLMTEVIEQAIKESMIKDGLDNIPLNLITSSSYKPSFITGLHDSESNIPLFTHPLELNNFKGKSYLCTDIRPYIKSNNNSFDSFNPDGSNIDSFISNKNGFSFALVRAILQLVWSNNEQNYIRTNLSFSGKIYALWLSEVISKGFALDPKDQIHLSIITHFFYQSLFYQEDVFYEDIIQLFAMQTIKELRVPSNLVFEVFDKIKTPITNIKSYCEVVKSVLENLRLVNFNEGVLITLISNSWYSYGINTMELLSIALEHPPTWATIVYYAVTDKNYNRTLISRISDRYGKGGLSNHYIKAFNNIIENHTITPDQTQNIFKSFR